MQLTEVNWIRYHLTILLLPKVHYLITSRHILRIRTYLTLLTTLRVLCIDNKNNVPDMTLRGLIFIPLVPLSLTKVPRQLKEFRLPTSAPPELPLPPHPHTNINLSSSEKIQVECLTSTKYTLP